MYLNLRQVRAAGELPPEVTADNDRRDSGAARAPETAFAEVPAECSANRRLAGQGRRLPDDERAGWHLSTEMIGNVSLPYKRGGRKRLPHRRRNPAQLTAPNPSIALRCNVACVGAETRSSLLQQRASVAVAVLFLGGMTTAAATLSPPSSCSRRTPWVARPASRMWSVPMRMILPYCEISMASDSSLTSRIATTLPLRSVVFTLITPLAPRPVRR